MPLVVRKPRTFPSNDRIFTYASQRGINCRIIKPGFVRRAGEIATPARNRLENWDRPRPSLQTGGDKSRKQSISVSADATANALEGRSPAARPPINYFRTPWAALFF